MQLSNYALLRLRFEEDFMNVLYKYVLYRERDRYVLISRLWRDILNKSVSPYACIHFSMGEKSSFCKEKEGQHLTKEPRSGCVGLGLWSPHPSGYGPPKKPTSSR